jgi:FtsZ-binding cell division protein ZapB
MDEPAALYRLVTRLQDQVSRQCATITTLQRDLKQVKDENQRLAERLSAREMLDALGVDVEPEPEPLPDLPDTVGAWTEFVSGFFATHRRQN